MIHITLALKSPFIIAENRIDNLLRSTDYISGSVIRGALAHEYLKSKHKDNKELFHKFFLSGQVRFGNCYLGSERTSIVPATARSCKNFSGFKEKKMDKEAPKHGVLDSLIRFYAYQDKLRKNEVDNSCLNFLEECEYCGSPTEHFTGFFGEIEQKGVKYESHEPKKMVITRTAIDENTMTAKEGTLFSNELIIPPDQDKGLAFHGNIFVTEGLEDELVNFLSDNTSFSIGGERTYGYGQTEIEGIDIINKSVFPDTDLKSRLSSFNEKVKQFLPEEESLYFVLTLNADAIVIDSFMRFVSCLDDAILRQYFPTELSFKMVESYCSTRIIKGWSNVHKLPKDNDLAIVKGSTFLFKTDKEIDEEELVTYLENIEQTGIGERKIEGFGEVIICHPFHLEVNPI